MLKPKKGDRVLVECVVTQEEDADGTFPRVMVNLVQAYVQPKLIKQILPREPKVGDTVWWNERAMQTASPYHGCKLIHIHQQAGDDRKWGVVAYEGGIPRSVYFEDLRLTR